MPILYTYSYSKGEYFYLNQEVKDTTTNEIGYIYAIERNSGMIRSENAIKVQYNKYKKIYLLKNQLKLEKVNPE